MRDERNWTPEQAAAVARVADTDTSITYEIRTVERFEIVRMESSENCGSTSTCGQFATREDAERVAELLRAADLSKATV